MVKKFVIKKILMILVHVKITVHLTVNCITYLNFVGFNNYDKIVFINYDKIVSFYAV